MGQDASIFREIQGKQKGLPFPKSEEPVESLTARPLAQVRKTPDG